MLLNIKSLTDEHLSSMEELIDHRDMPMILTDDKLFVLKKNKPASSISSGLRRGAKITRFLPAADQALVPDMQPREILSTTLQFDTMPAREVLVVCGCGFRLFVFASVGASLCRRVDELYAKMSGYDSLKSEPPLESAFRLSEKKFASLLSNMLVSSAEEFRRVRGLPFFNLSSIIDMVYCCIRDSRDGTRNKVRIGSFSPTLTTEGNPRDFALILSFAISFCMDVRSEGEVLLSVSEHHDDTVVSVSCDSGSSSYGLARMIRPWKPTASSPEPNDGMGFWLHMVRLLAEGNLWDFTSDIELGGGFTLSISVPRVGSVDSYLIRDSRPKELVDIVSVFFDM